MTLTIISPAAAEPRNVVAGSPLYALVSASVTEPSVRDIEGEEYFVFFLTPQAAIRDRLIELVERRDFEEQELDEDTIIGFLDAEVATFSISEPMLLEPLRSQFAAPAEGRLSDAPDVVGYYDSRRPPGDDRDLRVYVARAELQSPLDCAANGRECEVSSARERTCVGGSLCTYRGGSTDDT